MQKFTKESLNKSPSSSRYGYDEDKEFNVGFIPSRHGTYFIEIDDVISSVSQFSTAIQALSMAKEEDEIEILLQCDGGNVNATDALIHAMRKCQAPIHIIASGGCHSAATHILLEADSFELTDGFNALLHCGSDGAYGGVNEYMAKSSFDAEFRTRKFREAYEGMLSEAEIDNMLKGQDLWLDAKGWHDRAVKRMEYFQAKGAAQQAEMVAQMEAELAEESPPKKPKARKVPIAHIS
jgi:ATP-dependent protease ClpP protease subunit